jgi:predicted NBD/HSP70 family sugar kinase
MSRPPGRASAHDEPARAVDPQPVRAGGDPLAARLRHRELVDANRGALAEIVWGAGRGRSDVLYVKVATGVGAGLVLQGRLYHGAGGTAGEIGHMTIDEAGPVCRCGNRGCLEAFAGAEAGDLGCTRVIADAGRALGVARSPASATCSRLNA